jgi:hypothetical protein
MEMVATVVAKKRELSKNHPDTNDKCKKLQMPVPCYHPTNVLQQNCHVQSTTTKQGSAEQSLQLPEQGSNWFTNEDPTYVFWRQKKTTTAGMPHQLP